MNVQNTYARKAAKAIEKRLQREMYGAWRVGYDYLHVYFPMDADYSPESTYTISYKVLPSNSKEAPDVPNCHYDATYVLEAIDAEKAADELL